MEKRQTEQQVRPGRPERVAVVFNPSTHAKQADRRRELMTKHLEQAGVDLHWAETTPDDNGAGITRQAVADGATLVLAAGGDGTVRECADALAGTSTRLGIVPFGTGNLVARNLGIPLGMEKALDVATGGHARAIDVGRVNGETFLFIAGMGLDAAMLESADPERKEQLGPLAYVVGIVDNLDLPETLFTIHLDGADEPVTRKGQALLAANLGEVQGGIPVVPGTEPDDGLLDLMVVAARTPVDWARAARTILGGVRRAQETGEILRGRRITVRSERRLPVQRDGDPLGSTDHLDIEVLPRALHVVVPD